MAITKGTKADGLLRIMAVMIGNNKEKPIQQRIIEELATILNIRSCIIFRTFLKKKERKFFCKITAGMPKNEHGIGFQEELSFHPDLEDVFSRKEKFVIITDPKNDSRCQYFKSTIEWKRISEILYIPLIVRVESSEKTKGMIVIDKNFEDGRKFDDEEIEFCCQVAKLIAMIITREEEIMDEIRDKVLNKVICIGGFGNRLKTVSDELTAVMEDIKNMEAFFCEKEVL